MKPSLGRARPMAQKRIWLNKFLISISREDPWDCSQELLYFIYPLIGRNSATSPLQKNNRSISRQRRLLGSIHPPRVPTSQQQDQARRQSRAAQGWRRILHFKTSHQLPAQTTTTAPPPLHSSTHSWGTTSEGPVPEGDAGNFPLWITSLTAITQQRNITGWFACAGNFTFMGTSQG